jgi:hypothetical protein
MGEALPLRIRAIAPLVWILGAACMPSPKGATAGDSGSTGDSGATTGGPTSGSGDTTDPPVTTGDPDDSGTPCEPTGDPVCSAVPVTPGGDRGCGGEELTINGCDQLAGYELCPNRAIHRHTAGIACDDVGLCDPLFFSCRTDEDCGPGEACVCDVTWGDDHPDPGDNSEPEPFYRLTSCVYAECRTDADCPFGLRCGVETECRHIIGLFCHTPEDGCEGDADCPGRCGYSYEDKRWFCTGHVACE